MPSYRPSRASQVWKRSRESSRKNSRYWSTRRFIAKLETSMSNVGSAGGAAPITALPSAPNNRTASRSTSSPFTAAAAAESPRGRVLSARGRVRCRLSSTCWSAAESCSTRAIAAPSESTVWTAAESRTAGSTAPACDPAAPPHAAAPAARAMSVAIRTHPKGWARRDTVHKHSAVPSPRFSVGTRDCPNLEVMSSSSRREEIAENAVRRVQDRKSRASWRVGLGQVGPHEPRGPRFLPGRQRHDHHRRVERPHRLHPQQLERQRRLHHALERAHCRRSATTQLAGLGDDPFRLSGELPTIRRGQRHGRAAAAARQALELEALEAQPLVARCPAHRRCHKDGLSRTALRSAAWSMRPAATPPRPPPAGAAPARPAPPSPPG